MVSRIADLLNKARSASFFGREKELALFDELNDDSAGLPFFLLHLHGSAGQGKSSLLKRYREICDARNYLNLNVDGREIEPVPSSFLGALLPQVRSDSVDDFFAALAEIQKRVVLFVDSFERLSGIDDWMRKDFLPQLPDNVRVVVGSRKAPSGAFLADPGWQALMRVAQLRNFNLPESAAFLERRHVPQDKIQAVLDFAHGHPLALSVVADIFEQRPDRALLPHESPDVLRTLLDRFVQEVPSPAHRIALETCALAHLTTESLLGEAMGLAHADTYFDWLRSLSFVESGKFGLYPNDLAREALVADLRWRNPDRFGELHERAGNYYKRRIKEVSGELQRAFLFELTFLHRTNPLVRPFFAWGESSHWMDFLKPQDIPVLKNMVAQFEGEESAGLFEFWANHPCSETWVWRDGRKAPAAFILKIDSHKLADSPGGIPDPAVRHIVDYQRRSLHLRSGEQSAVFRFWMTKDAYQGVSELQSAMFLAMIQYYFSPGLAAHFLATAQPQFWQSVFSYADLEYVPELDFSANGMPMGFYAHDWRKRPPIAWLELLGKREIDANTGRESPLQAPKNQLIVLSEAGFEDAVDQALRGYHAGQGLEKNPLLVSRIVVKDTGLDATDGVRIDKLKTKISAAIKDIETSPLDGKYHRVLYRTFINPVGSQEKTADFLNMSFSTYRRYLKAGMEKVVERMWKEEVE